MAGLVTESAPVIWKGTNKRECVEHSGNQEQISGQHTAVSREPAGGEIWQPWYFREFLTSTVWRKTGLDAQVSAERFWSDPSCGSCLLNSSGEREYEGKRSDLGNTQDADPTEHTWCLGSTKEAVFLAVGLMDRGTTEARNSEGEVRFT